MKNLTMTKNELEQIFYLRVALNYMKDPQLAEAIIDQGCTNDVIEWLWNVTEVKFLEEAGFTLVLEEASTYQKIDWDHL